MSAPRFPAAVFSARAIVRGRLHTLDCLLCRAIVRNTAPSIACHARKHVREGRLIESSRGVFALAPAAATR